MEKQVHAHQVLAILDENTTAMRLDEFKLKVNVTFGQDAVFTNCHDDVFTFNQLMSFLQQRSKVVITGDTIALNKASVCNH